MKNLQEEHLLKIFYRPGVDLIADGFTKNTGKAVYAKFAEKALGQSK